MILVLVLQFLHHYYCLFDYCNRALLHVPIYTLVYQKKWSKSADFAKISTPNKLRSILPTIVLHSPKNSSLSWTFSKWTVLLYFVV